MSYRLTEATILEIATKNVSIIEASHRSMRVQIYLTASHPLVGPFTISTSLMEKVSGTTEGEFVNITPLEKGQSMRWG